MRRQKQVIALGISLLLSATMVLPALGQGYDPTTSDYGLRDIEDVKIGKSTDLKGTIANIINIALGFLGIIAVIFILYGGFMWMTAAGNEDQVGKARQMITQAVVGLAVVFAAYIISNFVIGQLKEATNVRA